MSLGTVVGLVVAMPYGVLADQAHSLVDDKGSNPGKDSYQVNNYNTRELIWVNGETGRLEV